MGIKKLKDIKKALEIQQNFKKVENHTERIFTKIDEEMYLISKSEKDEKKKEIQQKNLAIAIIAELLDSFEEKKDAQAIIEVFHKCFNE